MRRGSSGQFKQQRTERETNEFKAPGLRRRKETEKKGEDNCSDPLARVPKSKRDSRHRQGNEVDEAGLRSGRSPSDGLGERDGNHGRGRASGRGRVEEGIDVGLCRKLEDPARPPASVDSLRRGRRTRKNSSSAEDGGTCSSGRSDRLERRSGLGSSSRRRENLDRRTRDGNPKSSVLDWNGRRHLLDELESEERLSNASCRSKSSMSNSKSGLSRKASTHAICFWR